MRQCALSWKKVHQCEDVAGLLLNIGIGVHIKWASARQNQQYDLCAIEDSDQTGRTGHFVVVQLKCQNLYYCMQSDTQHVLQFCQLSPIMRKPVFGISDQVRLKHTCSATETSYSLETLDLASKGIILFW